MSSDVYLVHKDRPKHKYAYKKFVNGSWRYYYDDDDKPDKGFSVKNIGRWESENNIALNAPGVPGGIKKKVTSHYLEIDGVKGWQEVSKDVWDNSRAKLYYKNEPVKNIAKRKMSEMKTSAKKQVDKGKKFIDGLFDRKKKKG